MDDVPSDGANGTEPIVRDLVVCGIDPGLGVTGYAVVGRAGREVELIDAGVCRFDQKLPLAERLIAVERDIASIFDEHRPDIVAVEQLYSHYKHPRTAILMGHARGVMLLVAARAGADVRSYSATQVKRYLTGNGRATKAQMQRSVQTTLDLPSLPEPSDLADAIAIALCAAADTQRPDLTDHAGGAACKLTVAGRDVIATDVPDPVESSS